MCIRDSPRSELYTAIAVGAAIVLGTALVVWLIRPGTAGVQGGGGLFNRQPRMTILVLLTAAALAGGIAYLLRGRRRPKRLSARGSIAIGSAVAIVLAVVAGIFWPGGVIRHWPKQPKFSDTPPVTNPATVPTSATPNTVTESTTTVKPGGATSTVPGATTPTTATTSTTAGSTTTTKAR